MTETFFSPLQRRLLRLTVMLSAITLCIALIVLGFWAMTRVLSLFYNLILPLAVAGTLALILFPLVQWQQRTLGLSRVWAILLLFALILALLTGLLALLVPTMVEQATSFIAMAPGIWEQLQERLSRFLPGLTTLFPSSLEDDAFIQLLPENGNLGTAVMSYVGLVAGLGFVPLYLFFALLSGEKLRDQGNEVLSVFSPSTRDRVLYFVDVFVGYLTAFFRGQLLIALIMGVLLALGFSIIGLTLAIPLGLILGLLNIVPYLGTVVGLLLVLPIALFQPEGGAFLLAMALGVFAVVQLIESWLLTPRIMANQSGLPPVLVVISVVFWGIAFGGVIGMILAVPLTAFLLAVWAPLKSSLKRSLHPSANTPP
ncbi:MAG: AI-2E family transporter [Halomonadaceae bacterium]|nr:MAG: AI-2E family transporter [Halomonadaceae bacterium]